MLFDTQLYSFFNSPQNLNRNIDIYIQFSKFNYIQLFLFSVWKNGKKGKIKRRSRLQTSPRTSYPHPIKEFSTTWDMSAKHRPLSENGHPITLYCQWMQNQDITIKLSRCLFTICQSQLILFVYHSMINLSIFADQLTTWQHFSNSILVSCIRVPSDPYEIL